MKPSLLLIVLFLFFIGARARYELVVGITNREDCQAMGFGYYWHDNFNCRREVSDEPSITETPSTTNELTTSTTNPTTTIEEDAAQNGKGGTKGKHGNDGCSGGETRDENNNCVPRNNENVNLDETTKTTTGSTQNEPSAPAEIIPGFHDVREESTSTEMSTTTEYETPTVTSTSKNRGLGNPLINDMLPQIPRDIIEAEPSPTNTFPTTVSSTTPSPTTSSMESILLKTTNNQDTTSEETMDDSSTTSSTSQSTTSEPTTTGTDVTSTTTVISTFLMETTHSETVITDEDSTTTADDTTEADGSTSTTVSTSTITTESLTTNTTISLSDNSSDTTPTPLSTKTPFKNEIWNMNPGEFIPIEGITIFLCPEITTTTKLPTSSFTINPSSEKVTSKEKGTTYSTSEESTSTLKLESTTTSYLSSGGTKTAETESQGLTETNPTTVPKSTSGSSTWYGSSSSTVFSTSTGSSKSPTGSSTSITSMASTNPGTGTTSTSEIGTWSTGITGTQTSTTTSEAPTTSKFTSSLLTDSTPARSTAPTASTTSEATVSSSVASSSSASTGHETTSTTSDLDTPMYSIGSTTSSTVITSMSTLSSSTSIDSKELTSIGEITSLGIDGAVQSTQTPQTSSGAHETYGTLETGTEETTTETNELSTSSFEEETPLSSTGSTDLSDPISFTSSSYSDASVSTTTQKTTTTISSGESSSSAVTFSTESTAITAHEYVESSVSTVTSMEGNTENTETSATEMSSSRPVEVTDSTEVSSIQTELSSFSPSSTGVAVLSSKPESRSPTTSPAKTEETKPDVKTSTFFRSETTEEATTDSPSSLSAVPDSVESTTKVTSTSGKSSQPTTSGIKSSKESTQPTVVEPINSSSTTVDTDALTSSAPYSESISSTNEAPSSLQTTTGVLDVTRTMLQDEFTQATDTTTFATTPEAATTETESSIETTSAKIAIPTSTSPSKSTVGKVETTPSVVSTNTKFTSETTSTKPESSSTKPMTLATTPARPSTTDVASTTKPSSSPTVASSSTVTLKRSTPAKTGPATSGTTTIPKIESSTTSKTSTPMSAKLTTKSTSGATPLPSQSQKSSSASSPSEQSTFSGTSSLSTSSTSLQSTPSTTQNPLCKQQCPQGYLVGTSLCFQLIPASSKINSYQSALSYCKTTDRQTLASLDKIRDNADIKIIQESAGLQNIDWIYANGIGSKQERFQKTASVYSIFSQSLVSSPILMNVGISEVFGNVSALCVLPQYCNSTDCDVEKLFLAYEYYNAFKQTAGTLKPKEQGDVTCLYGNQKTTTVTCNSLGAIYPNPSNIDCEESAAERKIIDTTNQTVSSCKECFGRGTRECQEVLGENGNVEGYRCVCQEPFTMASCWRTENPCNASHCGENGKCVSELGDVSCECDWGFTGEKCETQLAKKFDGDFGYSSAVGATITLGGILLRVLKVALMGFTLSNEQGDDPQDTHQRLRTYLMTGAGVIMCFYSNPTLLAISPSACRFYYVAIHFCYMMAMLQWLFEGWNVNQVLRCVHLNQWEIDWQGRRSWGVRIAPRMILSFLLTGTFLLITFQTGWNKLAASWTCVGVICQETLNIWIPVFSAVLIIVLFGGTVYESSIMIKYRRPLLGYKIDMKIERELGREVGRRVQKCRENDSLSIIGLLLLVAQYISVIYSSDKRDEPLYGYVTVVLSGIYSTFCSYQEIITCPEDRADFYKRLQRWFPVRFAPDYNPETMWTLPEVKEFYSVPKAEREARYENFLSRNEKLYIHHRWDVRINQIFMENKEEFKINDALVQIWHEEMRDLKAKNGTEAQKYVIQGVYADYMDTVPDKDPRDAGKLKGRLELVTLAAEDDKNGVRLAKFFIVPTFHTFTPEMPDSSHTPQNEIIRDHERRLMAQLDTDIYELTREASEEQKTFVNSAIVFWNYGNKVVR